MSQSNVNLSQDSDDTQSNLSQELGETQFSSQSIEQALDILSFEAENLNDVQQQETAISNVNLLRNLMRQTGVTPMMTSPERPAGSTRAVKMDPSGGNSLNKTSADKGMDVASRVQNLGFVEFTEGLINGAFDAIIGATLKQMEAYAKLVKDLAQTLKEFQTANVSDAQIDAYLSSRYPDSKGGTSIRKDYKFEDTTDTSTGVETTATTKIKTITDTLILETSSLDPGKLTGDLLSNPVTGGNVIKIRTAISLLLASNMMSQLRAMAREGMARIVITDGSITSRLTFKVETTDIDIRQASEYRASNLNASVSGYYSGKKWGVSGAVGYSKINVSAVNETNFDKTTMVAEMFATVDLKFKTETFAPFEAPIVKAAPA